MLINAKTIIKDDNPLIREKSLDVNIPLSKEDEELANAMLTYVKESTNEEIAKQKELLPAVGISAIQVGIKKKILAIYIKDSEDKEIANYLLANAKIISSSIEKTYLATGEGCLSVANTHEGYVYRSARIKVKAYDINLKKEVIIEQSGYIAVVLQHEIDHFKGILYYDHINKQNPMYKDEKAIIIE